MDATGLRARLEALEGQAGAVIASRGAAGRYGLESALKAKTAAGWVWIDTVDPNPTQHTLQKALAAVGERPLAQVVAIGGGSAIDLAKALCALRALGPGASAEDILQSVAQKQYLAAGGSGAVGIIAVPTTAGTGSEVTSWATVWDMDAGKKYSVDAPWLVPAQVWLAPDLAASLPPRQTLSTGLDAVCQAAEAYWAKKSDPLVKALAVRAVEMAAAALPAAVQNGADAAARERMCTASLLSGIAFSKTRTTACHSISYPLTATFGIEHGFAAALTLAPVAARNAAVVDCTELLAAFAPFGDIRKWQDAVCQKVQPLRLSAFGVGRADLPAIAKNAFTAGRMDNNPVDFNEADVLEILAEVF